MPRSLDTSEWVLVGVTAAFALMGLTFACVGIWCFADSSTLLGYANTFYYNSEGVSLFGLQPGWTLVPCGLLGVLAIIIASVGTFLPSKGFIVFYIVYMCVLILGELTLTIVMLAGWPMTKATLKSAMETSMKDDYVGLPYSYTHNKPNSLLYDKLMVYNQCCGINSRTDFTANFATYASVWYTGYRSHTLGNGTGYTTTIPSACCMYNNGDTMVNNNDWLNYRNYLINQFCPVDQSNSFSTGCFETLALYSHTVISACMGVYFVVIAMHIAGVIAASIVYHTAHRVASISNWTEYSNGRNFQRNGAGQQNGRKAGRAGGGDQNGPGPYQGRQPRGKNPNAYGDGWGADNVYGRM